MPQVAKSENLDARRVEIEKKIAALDDNPDAVELINKAQEAVGRQRAEIANLEGELAELDTITGARVKQEREQAERAHQSQLAGMRQQVVGLHQDRLAAIADAESGARRLKANIVKVLDLNAKLARAAYALSDERGTPPPLAEADLVSRLASRISATMSNVSQNYRHRFGMIDWHGAGRFPADQSWTESEERSLAPHIQQLIENGE